MQVAACLEEMVKGLATGPSDIEAMRVLLLLPLCHFFRDPSRYLETLLGKYCLCISRLGARAAEVISKWWSLLTQAQFEDLLAIFKECVVYILSREMQVNKECGGLVSYEHFYIPDVTDKVDVQLDYIHWIQTSREDRSHKVYFCEYPFVFNAQAKTLILQTDSHLQMQVMKLLFVYSGV
ncbi:hypothetical protein V5799_015025 [Amblyomma americanum]|uniref:Uncharacterized protein n=1 Tax=Amblyomma americanum TaxID=6943 RepID=A0AAQ4E1C0_AMBAM